MHGSCIQLDLLTISVALLLGLSTFGQSASSANSQSESIAVTIEPSVPTSADSVAIIVRGALSCVNETVSSSHAVSGSSISVEVNVHHPDICATAVGSFEAREDIGRLAPGQYMAEATLNDECCFPCNPPPCVQSVEFTVVDPATLPETGAAPEAGSSTRSGWLFPATIALGIALVLSAGLLMTVARLRISKLDR